jgi:solute carrier family 6 amino acid transporter-like protein 5/7/9/14
MLQLMDTYAASWSVFLIAMLESIIIGWVYGAERFLCDIEDMIGRKSWFWHKFFAVFWQFLSPATLCVSRRVLIVFTLLHFDPSRFAFAAILVVQNSKNYLHLRRYRLPWRYLHQFSQLT